MMDFIDRYLNETREIVDSLDKEQLVRVIGTLKQVKESNGRVFVLGVGGSAANASHMVNDLRKIAGIESYTPVDNVAELTAVTNDIGFAFIFGAYLRTSKLTENDVLFVLSVGGGNSRTSRNLVVAMRYALLKGTKIISIVSRKGGYARKLSNECILIPVLSKDLITPHAEGFQGIIWHLLVNALVIK